MLHWHLGLHAPNKDVTCERQPWHSTGAGENGAAAVAWTPYTSGDRLAESTGAASEATTLVGRPTGCNPASPLGGAWRIAHALLLVTIPNGWRGLCESAWLSGVRRRGLLWPLLSAPWPSVYSWKSAEPRHRSGRGFNWRDAGVHPDGWLVSWSRRSVGGLTGSSGQGAL